jgi:hypothetical protein
MFKKHLTYLKRQLNVRVPCVLGPLLLLKHLIQGSTVQGKVSLTCDAWQASNTDGYFAVTVHWVDEPTPTSWELKSALIGFTRLNNAHSGEQLGQALFKVVKRMGIEHKVSKHNRINVTPYSSTGAAGMKVGHVTCDNTSNNTTMMKELSARLKIATGKKYVWKKRKIKCMHPYSPVSVTDNEQLSCACCQPHDADSTLDVQQVSTFRSKRARCSRTHVA